MPESGSAPAATLVFAEDVTRDLPGAHGGAPLCGRLKAEPEDFQVEEIPFDNPEGEGEHLLLGVRKRGLDTLEVARRLARHAGVHRRAVGFAGLKDRHALTWQRFSVHLPGSEVDWSALDDDSLCIAVLGRRRRKLRRGELAGNRFTLRLRAITGDREAAEAVLAACRHQGVPNYFGAQRFGRGASNLIRAQALFNRRLRRLPPEQLRMVTSAARSYLFNAVLAERVQAGDWDRALPGEVLLHAVEGRALPFSAGTGELEAAVARGEWHPSGPLPGRTGHCLAPQAEAAEREAAALARPPFPQWIDWLAGHGFDALRRSLRVLPEGLDWDWEHDALVLRFALPPGSYATALVRELMVPERT